VRLFAIVAVLAALIITAGAQAAKHKVDSGIRGEDAVTVDDQEKCLDWARRAGFARTFLLATVGTASAHEMIATLSELPARLEG